MTFGELKTLNIPDDAIIVVSGHEHSYRHAGVDSTTAVKYGRNQLDEDFGDEYIEEGGKRINVVLIS